MVLLTVIGIISVLTGLLFLSGEKRLKAVDKKLSDSLNKIIVNTDAFFLKNRQGTGICLILLGVLFFFIAYWLYVRAPVSMVKMFIQ